MIEFLVKQSGQSDAPNILAEIHDRQVHFAHTVLSKVTRFVTIKLLALIYSQQSGTNIQQNSHQRQRIEYDNEVIAALGKKSVEVLEDAVSHVSLDDVLSFWPTISVHLLRYCIAINASGRFGTISSSIT